MIMSFGININYMNTLNNSLDKILHGQKEISCEPLIEYLDDLNKQNHAELNNLKSKYLYSRNLKYRNVLKNIDLIISEKLEQVDKIKNSYKNNAELDNLKKNFKYQLDDLLNQIEVLRTRKSRIEKILEKTIENKNNVTFHKNLEDLIHFYKAFLIYSKTGDKNSYLEETRKINPNGNIIIYHISILFNFFIGEKKYINLNVFFKKYFSFQNIFKSLLLTPSISPETLKINKSPFINYEENNIGLENNQMLKNLKFFKIKPTYEKLDIEINLLLNQMYIVNILSNLLVDFNDKNERKVSHYTSTLVAENLVTDEFKIRLNMTDLMNDPTEGKILYNLLNINILETLHHSTFLTCFTFNHNSLNQFRLYGLTNNVPCSGISVVFNNDFFYKLNDIDQDHIFDVNKLPLFRCVYIDDFSGHIVMWG